MLVVIFFVFAKGHPSEIPEFIANFLITVVLFRSDKGKALSAFLTTLLKVLAALYGVDEATVDSFIATLIAFLAAFFYLYFCCHYLSAFRTFSPLSIHFSFLLLDSLALYKLSSFALNFSLYFFCLSALAKGIFYYFLQRNNI